MSVTERVAAFKDRLEALNGKVRVVQTPEAACVAVTEILEGWAGCRLIGPPEGGPRARQLIALTGRRGGAVPVMAVEGWAPEYGRPAEAQARWEAAHGRPMPDPIGSPR